MIARFLRLLVNFYQYTSDVEGCPVGKRARYARGVVGVDSVFECCPDPRVGDVSRGHREVTGEVDLGMALHLGMGIAKSEGLWGGRSHMFEAADCGHRR